MHILKSNYSYVQTKILYKLCNPISGYCSTLIPALAHTHTYPKVLKNTISISTGECGTLNNHSAEKKVKVLQPYSKFTQNSTLHIKEKYVCLKYVLQSMRDVPACTVITWVSNPLEAFST
jgi:hypothetical protein